MPAIERAFNKSVKAYREDCEKLGLKSGHEYELVIRRFAKDQVRRGRPILPDRVTRVDMYAWKDATASSDWNARHSVSVVNGWLRFHGNEAARLTRVRWPSVENAPGVWLTVEQKRVVESIDNPVQRWMAHCGFRLALRREEIVRLRVEDVQPGWVYVFEGKGRKSARLPARGTTPAAFAEIMQWREALIAAYPGWPADGTILLVPYAGRLRTPGLTWADNQAAALSAYSQARGGPAFKSHDMRRTCARHLYLQDVPIDRIRFLLRHERVETTLRYVGAIFDQVAESVRRAEAVETATILLP